MKTLIRKHPFNLAGRIYSCDLLLGIYPKGKRPALILVESEDSTFMGEPITIASINIDPNWLISCSKYATVIKDYSENEGLFPQLLALRDESEAPIFVNLEMRVTLSPFATAPVLDLSPYARRLYDELLFEMTQPKEPLHAPARP